MNDDKKKMLGAIEKLRQHDTCTTEYYPFPMATSIEGQLAGWVMARGPRCGQELEALTLAARVLQLFTLKQPVFGAVKMELKVTHAGLVLEVSARVVDRDDEGGEGAQRVLSQAFEVNYMLWERFVLNIHGARASGINPMDHVAEAAQWAYRFVRESVRLFMQHELDEMLCLNGKRFSDPHEGERR